MLASVLALSFSPASADSSASGDIHIEDVNPTWRFPPPQGSEITANYVATKLLPQLIGSDDQLRQRLGFKSPAPINTPILSDSPFAVFRVGLTRLKKFSTTSSGFFLLLADENWFSISPQPSFPPKVMPVRFLFAMRELTQPPSGCTDPSGCIASSVQVKRLSKTWEFQQIGRPGLISKLTQYGNGRTHVVVWIPVLNLHYLAKVESVAAGLKLKIKAIAKDRYVMNPNTGKRFDANEELDAEVVFNQLQAVANPIDPNSDPG